MSANILLRVDLLMFRQKQQIQQRFVGYVELNFDVLDAGRATNKHSHANGSSCASLAKAGDASWLALYRLGTAGYSMLST